MSVPRITQIAGIRNISIVTFSLLLFLTTIQSIAQQKMPMNFSFNLKADTSKVRIYKPVTTDKTHDVRTLVLRMKYGDDEILNPEDAKDMAEGFCNVISIDLVYTDYQELDVQNLLNKKRLTELYFIAPDIFNQSTVEWKFIKQMGYSSEEDARKLFHGFVIHYIKVVPATREEFMKSLAELRSADLNDTALYRPLDRCINYKKQLLCVDLTGSMSPYFMQVFFWLKLQESDDSLRFSFFNDGDMKPDYLKRTGSVGGVYTFKTNVPDTIAKYAVNCISGGGGGDSPENNVEAILKGLKTYPDTKEVVIVVDNWADMRDYSYISDIKKPVRVVLCGTNLYGVKRFINPQYLDLARKTGGSIHTMEEDIENLAKLKEGEEISIGGTKYLLSGGKFFKV